MSDLLKGLWSKLYAWALPSALAIGAYWVLVYPETKAFHHWLDAGSDGEIAGIFAALVGTMAFCLNAFSTPLYRILEGYLLWPRCLQKLGGDRQLKRKQSLQAAIQGKGWRRGLALERLSLYPLRDEQVVPTRFGNALRSFETYGKTRFNLDSQTLWNELCAVAPKYVQDELDTARSSVDFFVAAIYLSAAFGCATLAVAYRENSAPALTLIGLVAFPVSFLCHWLAVRATRNWGLAVQALVNTGRVKLADTMGLQLPDNLDAEKRMWGLVTSYVYSAKPETGASIDRFRKPHATSPPEDGSKAGDDKGDADDV